MNERGWASRELRRADAELNELPAFVRLLAGEINAKEYAEAVRVARASRSEAEGARTQFDPGDECACGGC